METPHLTRRRLGIGLGTTLALGAAGVALGSRNARAQASVTLGELGIEDTELGAEDGKFHSVHILLDGEWEYRNLDAEPAEWRAYLMVAPEGSDSWSAIGMTDGDPAGTEASGTFGLRGRVTASGAFAPENFAVASDGSPTTTTVRVGVLFMALDADGETLVEAQVTRPVDITVTQTGASASLGATGVVAGQDDQSDPTPTPLP